MKSKQQSLLKPRALAIAASGYAALSLYALFSSRFWTADLLANLAIQFVFVGGIVFGLALWFRARASCAITLLGIAPMMWLLFETPRATLDAEWRGSQEPISLLVFNAYAQNETPEAVLELLRSSGVDVAAVLGMPAENVIAIRDEGVLEDVFAYTDIPSAARGGYPIILSRWPFKQIQDPDDHRRSPLGARGVEIDRPAGSFRLALLHPSSPRNPERWSAGNETLEHDIRVLNSLLRRDSMPLVVLGDFNSTPSGYRSRRLSSATGLQRGKPRWRATGTWPSNLFWPFQVAIDDVFLESSAVLGAWETMGPAGSDHLAVRVEIAFRHEAPDQERP